MSFVLCVGEALIDLVGQSYVRDVGASETFRRAAGGAVANVAVGIVRLGGEAHFAGALSRDAFGHYLLRTLASENVNVDGVRTVDASTTLAFVARGEDGERDFLFVRRPGADSLLEAADIDMHELTRARIVHFGGVLLSSEPARSACFAAAASARRARVLVSFDPNVRPALWQSREEMKRITLAGCANATLVKLSEDDLMELEIDPSDVRPLFNEVTQVIIVTRGARGAAFFTGAGDSGDARPPHIEPVDTTGAGDAAMSAILRRLERRHCELSRDVLSEAIRYGAAAGALACLREGAIPSLPTAEQVEAVLPQVAQSKLGKRQA